MKPKVIRRIDDLGRVVIPKSIREILGIQDGDSLGIATEGNKIILKKLGEVE